MIRMDSTAARKAFQQVSHCFSMVARWIYAPADLGEKIHFIDVSNYARKKRRLCQPRAKQYQPKPPQKPRPTVVD